MPGDEEECDVLEGVDDDARDEERDEEERGKEGNLPPRLQKRPHICFNLGHQPFR